jgi:hypothetical protein
MQQAVLAPVLDESEKQFLYEQRYSEHFRVFQKAIVYLYSLEATKLSVAQQAELPVYQGRLQGLLIAKNLLCMGSFPEEQKNSPTLLRR